MSRLFNTTPPQKARTGFNPVSLFYAFFERRVEILHKIPIFFLPSLLYKIEGKGGAAHVDPTLTPVWDRDFSLGGGALVIATGIVRRFPEGGNRPAGSLPNRKPAYLLEDNRAAFPVRRRKLCGHQHGRDETDVRGQIVENLFGVGGRLSASCARGSARRFVWTKISTFSWILPMCWRKERRRCASHPDHPLPHGKMNRHRRGSSAMRSATMTEPAQVESGGRILLVHAPLLEEISDATPVRVYQFDSADYVLSRGRNCRSSRRAGRARNHPPGANPLNRKPVRRSSICLTGRSPFRSWRIPTRNTSASCASPGRTGASKLPAVWQPGISWRC